MVGLVFRVSVVSIAALLAGPAIALGEGPAPADNAMQQLENGTSGDQSTGQTFDGGRGPSDAYPYGAGDDGSVVNPDGNDSAADSPDNDGGDQDDGSDPAGDDQGPPATDPA